jgi:outer membrane receptor protein involved in Fe transport
VSSSLVCRAAVTDGCEKSSVRATRHPSIAVASAVALLSATHAAAAADPSDLEELLSEPVVQTASKSAEEAQTAPATATIITADDIRRYGIRSLDEAINFLSLGMYIGDNMDGLEAGSRGVLLTGDYGNHVLLLVDGHVITEEWGGTTYFGRGAGIPMEIIDHIEIIVGPGSVLYGSSAMLGVINVVTKRAKDFAGVHLVGETDLFTSYRLSAGAGLAFTLLGKPAEVTTQLEYYNQDGPAFTLGPETYGSDAVTGTPKCFNATCSNAGTWGGTAADKQNYVRLPTGYLRFMWGDLEADVRGEVFKRAYPFAFGAYNDPDNWETDRWLSGDLRHRWAISSTIQLKSRLYGDTYDYDEQLPSYGAEDCLVGQNRGCVYSLRAASRWVGLEEQLSFNWLKDDSLDTLVGADVKRRFYGARTDYTDILTGFNQGTVTHYENEEWVGAAYVQQTWKPARWLSLNAGARLDDYANFAPRLSPRAAVAVTPWDGGTWKVVYSEAFRAPTAYERLNTDYLSRVTSLDLRPETVRSIEGSFEQRFSGNRVLFGCFATRYSDLIISTNLTPDQVQSDIAAGLLQPQSSSVLQYQNVDSVDNWGFNGTLEGTALHRSLAYGVNITGAYSRRNTPAPDGTIIHEPLAAAPSFFGNARVSYDLPGDLPVVALATAFYPRTVMDQAYNGGFTTIPYGPGQFMLRATLSGPVPGLHGLTYRVSARYAVSGNGLYQVGPNSDGTVTNPVDPFRTTVGVQYDFR